MRCDAMRCDSTILSSVPPRVASYRLSCAQHTSAMYVCRYVRAVSEETERAGRQETGDKECGWGCRLGLGLGAGAVRFR